MGRTKLSWKDLRRAGMNKWVTRLRKRGVHGSNKKAGEATNVT